MKKFFKFGCLGFIALIVLIIIIAVATSGGDDGEQVTSNNNRQPQVKSASIKQLRKKKNPIKK